MASGGARSRSGPPPDPNALRRERDLGEWIELPHEGRQGDAPDWPLEGESENFYAEAKLWAELWSMPQALVWDRQRQQLEVALYVRRCIESSQPGANTALGTLVRQMADSLGLTTPGLRANRWKITPPASTDVQQAPPARSSSRERLKVIRGGGG